MSEKQVIGVAGLGLIGGSFALDMLTCGHAVLGHDIDPQTCRSAMDNGIVHQASSDCKILDDCSAILLAVPVGSIRELLIQLAKLNLPNLHAVFDASSTKSEPTAWASQHLGSRSSLFVACHPIAGKERSGVHNAHANLFRDHQVVLCDPPDNSASELVKNLWQQCGCEIKIMSAAGHDRIFAAVSHLPHMLAYLLVNLLGSRPDKDQLLSHAAGGFADFTRIASSDPDMWRDVCISNSENILTELNSYRNELDQLAKFISTGDKASIHNYFAKAREQRDGWLAKRNSV